MRGVLPMRAGTSMECSGGRCGAGLKRCPLWGSETQSSSNHSLLREGDLFAPPGVLHNPESPPWQWRRSKPWIHRLAFQRQDRKDRFMHTRASGSRALKRNSTSWPSRNSRMASERFLLSPRLRVHAREPLRRVHEAVFAILALENEPVDPRL